MIEITWLGHSSFQFKLASGEVYMLDPWTEGNPKYPAGHVISRADYILVSHGHFDHIASTVDLAKKHGSKVVSNYEICMWLQSKGVEAILPMNKGGAQQLGPLKATMTHAMHSSGIQDGNSMIYGGEAAGWILEFAGGRCAYFAGDTDVFGDMKLIGELYKPELAILPIGDLFTMGPRQAALACRMIGAKKVIPMHWGTFPLLTGTPEELGERIKDLPGTQVWTLEPGRAVSW
ncbi:MAG: metal-dependent hydrolase [Acidimicrobiia bacterium]|nr:metal-dependent hydrolase [Acidimicrobiia bacterium]